MIFIVIMISIMVSIEGQCIHEYMMSRDIHRRTIYMILIGCCGFAIGGLVALVKYI